MQRILRASVLALSLFSCGAFAQDGSASADLKQQMTPSEFKAAGLGKLSPEEMNALNAWMNRNVGAASSAAVVQARAEAQQARAETAQVKAQVAEAKAEGRKEVVTENRGFLTFGTDEPIESTIAGAFTGFGKGMRWTLANGQTWEQTDSVGLAGVKKSAPKVSIKPGFMGVWYMRIEGFNTAAKVKRVK